MLYEVITAKTMLPASDASDIPAIGGIGADAVMALEAMGVPAKEASARVEKVITANPSLTLEEIVRAALQG